MSEPEPGRSAGTQEMALIYAVMICVAILVLIQILLLSVAVEGLLGGEDHLSIPAAVGSGACFALAGFLVRRLGSG